MFEFILAVSAAIALGRFAETDRGEGLKWGGITFGLCLVSFLVPVPFLRVLIAIGLAFILMTATRKTFY